MFFTPALRMFTTFLFITALLLVSPVQADEKKTKSADFSTQKAPADPDEYDVKAHYDKAEYRVPMRDGVELFTTVYTPKATGKTYPIMLYRTPYSIAPYGLEEYRTAKRMAPSVEFVEDGYIFVMQDVRGKFRSEGDFVVMRPLRDPDDPEAVDETTDTYDTIEWALQNLSGNSGKVGQWGISYSAWQTVMGMIEPHPALAAVSPQASPSDMYIGDDWHHNGAFRLMYAFWWMSGVAQIREKPTDDFPEKFEYGTPWGYEFFLNAGPTSELNYKYFGGKIHAWKDFMDHPDYDEFWQAQNVLRLLRPVSIPVLNVAGWFDSEDYYGPLTIYHTIEKKTPLNQNTLVIGPWLHGGWASTDGSSLGDIQFGSKTSEHYQQEIVFPFFQYHLKGKGEWNPAEAIVFETGGNRWHRFDQWPPEQSRERNLYFQPGGKLSFDKPAANSTAAFDSYVSDPAKPVPFTTEMRTNPGHTWMIEDQRQVSTRPDVLVYQTDVLEEDISIAGPILARLFASTTGTDSDWFVKLIDVYPGDAPDNDPNPRGVSMGSYQMLVGVEVMRGKYRNSFSKPEAMVPDQVTPIDFTVWDKFHTFRKGHKIMVQVHSSWFPAYDRNPQQFLDIYAAGPDDYQSAIQKIHRSEQAPSHLVLPVIEGLEPIPDAVGESSEETG